MDEYKILIIEDEKQMAMFLEMELNHEGYRTRVENNGIDGLKQIENGSYNLILLDLMLPGMDGIEICKRVRGFSDIPIIMLTAKGEISDRVKGLDTGADDYLTKPFAIEELLARIRVFKRKTSTEKDSNELKAYDLIMNRVSRQVTRGNQIIELTKKEYDLLEILLINKNVVLTREQLIEAVWGYDYVGDTNVVDVFIRYIRSKIDDGFENKIITTVRGVGYVIKGDTHEIKNY